MIKVGAMTDSAEAERFRLLYELGCAFAAKTDLTELIPFVIAKCREALNAGAASMLLLDRETNEFYFPYVSDENASVAGLLAQVRVPADSGIAGAALKTGKPIVVADAQTDPRFYRNVDRETGEVTRNLVAVPLTSAGHSAIGVLEVLNRRNGEAFGPADITFLEAVSDIVTIAIENARLYEKLRDREANLLTQVSVLRRDNARNTLFAEIIGSGLAMEDVFRLMESAAASFITVLIEGETGTGKELVARGIHRASGRCEGPFVAVNCAALPETLLESELFGHRRGSFTGAIRDSPGVFRAAAGGVVFLDEVADMPAHMQAKLLRVLEQEEVIPVGDTFPVKVDVRILSATNRDLKVAVEAGDFREDLYYRLSAFPIRVPPLRDRRDDIPVMASRFVSGAAERHKKNIAGIDATAIELLIRFDWPGNVRQLRNEIERAVALAHDGETLTPSHLSAGLRGEADAPRTTRATSSIRSVPAAPAIAEGGEAEDSQRPLREARGQWEAQYISNVLRRHQWNVSHAAQALGISRPALQEKMKAYRLR
jgi:transcriptional regulator with GAF, ATPase, and Fis domain